MKNIFGLAIIALGVLLLIFGYNESQSFGSEISRAFTGNPTDRSMWFMIGGGVAVIVGLALMFQGRRR